MLSSRKYIQASEILKKCSSHFIQQYKHTNQAEFNVFLFCNTSEANSVYNFLKNCPILLIEKRTNQGILTAKHVKNKEKQVFTKKSTRKKFKTKYFI